MLRFLLDEHISPRVAAALKLRQPKLVVFDVHSFNDGALRGLDDETLLNAAFQADLTFVTFDVSTIPEILFNWAEANHDHGGVVFANSKVFRPDRIGELVTALEELWLAEKNLDWSNRVVFLKKAGSD